MRKGFATILPTILAVASAAAPAVASDAADRLRERASRLDAEGASPALRFLASTGRHAPPGWTRDQAAAAAGLDGLARDALKIWLLRGLDGEAGPSPRELADRLGEGGEKARRLVVGHLQAIAIEAIFTPAQAKVWHPEGFEPAAPMPGRYGVTRRDPPPADVAGCMELLRSRAEYSPGARGASSVLLGQVRQPAPARGAKGPSPAQLDLIGRLDRLVGELRSDWYLRDVQRPTRPEDRITPAPPALLERLGPGSDRRIASVVAHAEAVALEVVLDPDQADRARGVFWSGRGIEALLDPDLTARLGMSKRQRDEVAERLARRRGLTSEVDDRLILNGGWDFSPFPKGHPERALRDAADRQMLREAASVLKGADAYVIEKLTPAQWRKLVSILGTPRGVEAPATAPPAEKTKRRPRAS